MATVFANALNGGVMKRAQRGFNHLRRGTLVERIQMEWQNYVKHKRLRWWRSQSGKREYIEKKIESELKIRLYFDSILCHHIYFWEGYEKSELLFLRALLRPGDIFIDIGANIGLYTLIAAQRVGEEGHIHAFEPSAKPYQRLLENVMLNRLTNVTCHRLGLSDTRDTLRMTVSLDGYDAWNSFGKPVAGRCFGEEMVECICVDDFLEKESLIRRVTLMKLDVEGWESRVLSGGRKALFLEDAPILLVEFTEQASQASGSSCSKTYDLLEELGYEMFTYDAECRRLIPDPRRERYPYLNLIAAKNSAWIASRLQTGC
jgi:FkbM family methyltransferase